MVLICSMLFQVLFFENFYLNKKINGMTREAIKFSEMYSYDISNQNRLTEALFRFEQSTNSKIAIFSTDGKLKYLLNYNNNDADFQTLTSFCKELIDDKYLINKVLTTGKSQTSVFENEYSNTRKIGILTPMSLNSKNDSIVVTVSSMQPINEATDVIREFYFYLFLGFTIVGIFLSSVYANLISKPLVNINKVAKRMSAMDFTAKCEETSQDEIGNLAITLNFLSSTLKNALEDLKHKNKKLEEDIEKERKLEEMRKDFVASVSHDLKTPIGIIEGYAEGLKDGIVSGKDALIYIETIIDESHKMNKLVTNMLELSKLESGNLELVIERFNILRLIQKLLKSFKLEFDSNEINLELKTDLEYCYVLGDIFQLEQVITNLLSNALKYTPSKNNVIVMLNSDDELVTISIENKGAHIPDDEIENLYNKFYRIDKARNSSNNSNGLGLAIVKRILTLHESSYTLCNTEDGVKFEFTLKKSHDKEIL
ncbi:HAMP domain-containing sensor histidine kinase [Clostridium sp. AL.422]|uniref:sensor histidine kinase n=1 Tax=Clostridium TaxID=1485 RepID=UPI00293DF101|nr:MULTISPECIES: HAMP domain-containing sensor histidine kinase [unclassified Clostridium]MDV4150575.1 HAMP domain-containing sensor histidine kinase [Clostridium sp. AL.422]